MKSKRKSKQPLTLVEWFKQVQQWYKVLDPHYPTPQDSRGWEGYWQNGLTPEIAVRQDIDSGA